MTDTITVTQGPQNARIDPGSGLRWYTWEERRDLISVTSARTEAGMPHGLHQWTLSQVIDRAVDNADEIHRMLNRPRKPRERVRDKNARAETRHWLRGAATDERDRKAHIGTAVHDMVAQGIAPDDVPEYVEVVDDGKVYPVHRDQIIPRLLWFLSFLAETGAEILAQEFQLWNLTEGYAGSGDLLVRFPNGSIWLIDIKTGDKTYFEHAMQVSGYRHSEFSGRDNVVDPFVTGLLRRISGCAVLHLNEDGWEFVSLRYTDKVYQAFLHVLGFARISLEMAHNEGYVLARKAYPEIEAKQDAVVASMAAELERRTAA